MRRIGIGKQDFAALRETDCFYVDKTDFIREWWDGGSDVTLITRPRRFGKTLNMSMLECFFSLKYAGRGDLFAGLDIWKREQYRSLQGTFPVIFLSLAGVKDTSMRSAVISMKQLIVKAYQDCGVDTLTVDMDDETAMNALNSLSSVLYRRCGKKVIILLDEYDTPMQEAYISGYWNEMASFLRTFFNKTFKTNSCLERAVMTGITRVGKESMFSDFNNPEVITTTSEQYEACFGFTEPEVFAALEEYGLGGEKEEVKRWYDGFTFGKRSGIYNPWSITSFLKNRVLKNYWANTSSNELLGKLIGRGSAGVKKDFECLLRGDSIFVELDEQVVFNRLEGNPAAVWSLLLASGYLRTVRSSVTLTGLTGCELAITNLETRNMFEHMVRDWFAPVQEVCNEFTKALLQGDVKEMNRFMNRIAMSMFSVFDVGKRPSEAAEPERFYHGFVLGLLVELRERYRIRSNRESGYGRYDVLMEPENRTDPAIILEFKVHDPESGEKDLQDTVEQALCQIEGKHYAAELMEAGIARDRIRSYGFAFEGKRVLIGAAG